MKRRAGYLYGDSRDKRRELIVALLKGKVFGNNNPIEARIDV